MFGNGLQPLGFLWFKCLKLSYDFHQVSFNDWKLPPRFLLAVDSGKFYENGFVRFEARGHMV